MKLSKNIILPLMLSVAVFVGNNAVAQKKKKQPKNNKKIVGKEQTTESGLKYTVTSASKKGVRPQKGDIVEVHYVGRLFGDTTIFDSSYKRGEPIRFPLGEGRVIKGWDEGIALLFTGDKATLIIPPQLAYGERGAGNVIPPNATLEFEVELVKVEKPRKPFNTEGKDTITTASGLKIIKINETEGAQPEVGETVIVHYSGYLKDSMKKFDSSYDRGKPFEFKLGKGQVIKGWDEGIALLKKGEKARLIIPSNLGYGANGAGGVIPPNADLIFDVELIGIK